MATAKENFDKFVFTDQSMLETTKQECEQKMMALQACNITFSTGWVVFWIFFGGIFLGLVISLIVGFSNNSTRTNRKNQELMRLQMKINHFASLELQQQNVQVPVQNQLNNN